MALPALLKFTLFWAAATTAGHLYCTALPTTNGTTMVTTSCWMTRPYGTWPVVFK
jgi:hypothetical protein